MTLVKSYHFINQFIKNECNDKGNTSTRRHIIQSSSFVFFFVFVCVSIVCSTYLQGLGRHTGLPVGLVTEYCAKITDNVYYAEHEATCGMEMVRTQQTKI